jgi:hypothetical protein
MGLRMKERKAVTAVSPGRRETQGAAARRTGTLTASNGCGGAAARRIAAAGAARGGAKRPRVYDAAVLSVLRRVWVITDCICGKRLAAVSPETLNDVRTED